jgi:hypothetical protein
MNGEVGRDMNEASPTRSIVDNVVPFFSQKSKSGASKFACSGSQSTSVSNPNNLIQESYPDCTDSRVPYRDPVRTEMVNLSKSPYSSVFPQAQGPLNMSSPFALQDTYLNQHATSSPEKERQKMQLLQLHREQLQLRLQQQKHEQQQIQLHQLQRQATVNRQSPTPKQPTGNSPQRHNREYIGGAAAAAYNALRHDYYAAKQDGQSESQKQNQNRPNRSVNDSIDKLQSKNSGSGIQLPRGFPNFVRTDPRE